MARDAGAVVVGVDLVHLGEDVIAKTEDVAQEVGVGLERTDDGIGRLLLLLGDQLGQLFCIGLVVIGEQCFEPRTDAGYRLLLHVGRDRLADFRVAAQRGRTGQLRGGLARFTGRFGVKPANEHLDHFVLGGDERVDHVNALLVLGEQRLAAFVGSELHVVESELVFGLGVGVRADHLDRKQAAALRQLEHTQRARTGGGDIGAIEVHLLKRDRAVERDLDHPVRRAVEERRHRFVTAGLGGFDREGDVRADLALFPQQRGVIASDPAGDHLLGGAPEG